MGSNPNPLFALEGPREETAYANLARPFQGATSLFQVTQGLLRIALGYVPSAPPGRQAACALILVPRLHALGAQGKRH